MKPTKRKQVYRSKEITYTIEGPLSDAIAALQELQKEQPTAKLEISYEYDAGVASVYWFEDETDAEQAQRLKSEAVYKEYRRKQLETLKKEFGE